MEHIDLAGISDNGRRRIYKVVSYLAHSDGELHEAERSTLDSLREHLGLHAEEAAHLEDEAKARQNLQLKPEVAESDAAVQAMADLMLADGALHPKEAERIRKIAQAVGIKTSLVARALQRAMVRKSQLESGSGSGELAADLPDDQP